MSDHTSKDRGRDKDQNSNARDLRLTIDEITQNADGEQLASLVSDDGDGFVIPLSLLPEGTRDGDVIRIHLEREPDETKKRSRRIAELQRRLFS